LNWFAENDTTENNTEAGDQWSKTLNWYFFVVSNYFLYGESIIYYFKVSLFRCLLALWRMKKRGNRANGSCDCFIGAQHIVFVDAYFLPFAQNHRFISFMLYVFGESQSEMLLAETLRPLTFFVRDRLHGLCDEPAKAVFETTIRSVLLGPHDATVDRRFEVG
jgi:hypothetical protein